MVFKKSTVFLALIASSCAQAMQQPDKLVTLEVKTDRVRGKSNIYIYYDSEAQLIVTKDKAIYQEKGFLGSNLIMYVKPTPAIEQLQYFLIMLDNAKLCALTYREYTDGTTQQRGYCASWESRAPLMAFNASTYTWLGNAAKKVKNDIEHEKNDIAQRTQILSSKL